MPMPIPDKAERIWVVDEVIEAAGGVRSLARQLGIAPPSVSAWKQIPAERCLQIERLTGISRYRLRPDVYGPAPARERA